MTKRRELCPAVQVQLRECARLLLLEWDERMDAAAAALLADRAAVALAAEDDAEELVFAVAARL